MKKNILVSVDRGETRVAVLEGKGAPARGRRRKKAAPGPDWKVAELYVERRGRRSIVGNIYKGKVDNVLPGMGPPSSTSAWSETASSTSTRSSRPTASRCRAAVTARAGGSTSC